MKLAINPIKRLHGTITLPSSKSQSIRALLLAVLAKGKTTLLNVLDSDDTNVAKLVCTLFGIKILSDKEVLEIESSGLPLSLKENKINTGNSGITTRFVLPMLGLRANSDSQIFFDCGDQMRQRPITSLIQALNNLGMEIKSANDDGCCPLLVAGKLIGGKTQVDGLTSQFVSALLLSLPCAANDSEIVVKNLHERPYVEMTLEWLRGQDIQFTHYRPNNTEDIFTITGGQNYHSFKKQIPADFSSASYPLAAAVLIPGEVSLQGVDMEDQQGDKRLVDILKQMGADIEIQNSELIVKGGKKLHGVEIDANDIPDMVPTLAVIGTQTEGGIKIVNVKQARFKETDRIHSMAVELKKMGATIEEMPDGLIVKQSNLFGQKVHGYSDHRTIMALAVAGLMAKGQTEIDTAEGINKTFPNFVELMNMLGCEIEVINN